MKYWGTWVAAAMLAAGCSFDLSAAGGGLVGTDGGAVVGADASPNAPDARVTPRPDAGAPTDPPGTVRSRRGTPNLTDRDFSDWDDATLYSYDISNSAHLRVSNDLYQTSAKLTFASMHDDDYVYFALIVEDDYVSGAGEPLWDDDSVSIMIDADFDAAGPLGSDDHEIIIASTGSYADYAPGEATVVGDAFRTTDGYAMEVGILKSSLRDGPVPSVMGFDIAINEDDAHGNETVDAYGVWFMSDRPVCETCCQGVARHEPWCDTTTYGTLTLQ